MTPPRKPEHANTIEHLGNGYTVERVLQGYAYPRNGNLHNATPRYHWVLRLEGRYVDSSAKRGPLVEEARKDAYR